MAHNIEVEARRGAPARLSAAARCRSVIMQKPPVINATAICARPISVGLHCPGAALLRGGSTFAVRTARLQPALPRVIGGMYAHMAAASSRHSAIASTCSSITVVRPGSALD